MESEVVEQQSLVVTGRTRELKTELDAREAELDGLRDRHRALTREHEATRKDCEGMLKASAWEERNAHGCVPTAATELDVPLSPRASV